MITQERLKQLFECNPEMGLLTWRKNARSAGCVRHDGYVVVGSDKRLYLRHRLIWLYVNGSLPSGIDHVNGVKGDDRIDNLRAATQAQNVTNSRRPSTNKSGVKGVHWHPQSKRWRVQIGYDKRKEHIGLYETIDEAAQAYAEAARRKYGQFARLD